MEPLLLAEAPAVREAVGDADTVELPLRVAALTLAPMVRERVAKEGKALLLPVAQLLEVAAELALALTLPEPLEALLTVR